MGENIVTELKQVGCDELCIGWDQLDAVLPDTTKIARVRATVGSESVKDLAIHLIHDYNTKPDCQAKNNSIGLSAFVLRM